MEYSGDKISLPTPERREGIIIYYPTWVLGWTRRVTNRTVVQNKVASDCITLTQGVVFVFNILKFKGV